MRRFFFVFALTLLLAAGSAHHAAARQFSLAYSNDVAGELEPCG